MTEPTKTEKPSDRLTINIAMPGETEMVPTELFMSAGLVRRLAQISQQFPDLSQLYVDLVAQDILMTETLRPRTPRGQPVLDYELTEFKFSTEDGQKLMNWITEHVLYFFTETVRHLMVIGTDQSGTLMKLMDSMSGLKTLASQKQLAGHSATESVT